MNEDLRASEGLEKLGYKQELSRSRGLMHILFTYGLAAPIATSLIGGGPATMIWGLVLVSALTLTLALSLAEICSLYPTSAGAYYWTYKLASPRTRLLLSWINGWMTLVGVWTVALSVNFGTGQLIVAGAGIFHPEWVATAWQTYLIYLAVITFSSAVCLFFNKYLPLIDVVCAWWTGLGIIGKFFLSLFQVTCTNAQPSVTLVALSAEAKAGRRSAGYALGHFDPSSSGWTPGWTFFIGLLPPAYTFSAIGMIASMAEEVHKPSEQLPHAIVLSVPVGAISGLIYLLPIVFTLPDTATLLAVASGQPIGVMYTLIMGSNGGGFGMWFILFGVGIFCAVSISCAASRATWAFARDHAVPFSYTFARVAVPPRTSDPIPVNAFLLSTAVQVLLGLIYLGSSTAFNAFVGVAVICLGLSNVMPIFVSMLEGRRHVARAPYNLGAWGMPLNAIACAWILFAIVLFCMPTVVPPTPQTMNYASVVFVGFGLLSAAWYLIGK
ncbi:amino acid/polyamine transporter I [Vararia minispora EC-137]|uniref:Amino acid/polyamine transporter I n=1 Tax=Vararia minispora EC-137 TaxID=1314806 RepID=A0ACB8QTD4_9AGAM|nr:amino acid/polyamine transporter I [Vararia minispora EC-137]